MRNRADEVSAALSEAASAAVDPAQLPIASPWSTSDLARIVADDVFPGGQPINTRSAAMRIPAVARARNLIVSTICQHPLVDMTGDTQTTDQPTWLYRSDDGTSPQHRMAWTVDDLIFYGWSCWWRDNTAPSDGGFPANVRRLNRGDWSIDADMQVLVNGVPVDPRNVIVIPGLHEGILSYGVDALADARTLYANVRRRINNPVAQVELHQTGGRQMDQDEIDDLVAGWAAARRGENGGVAYTNEFIEMHERGAGGEELMIDARNASALDLARVIGVAGSRIDATVDKASLTYETTTGRNQEFVDFDLDLYMTPVTARLSLDDVSRRGHRVAFDVGDLTQPTPAPTGPTLED